MEIPVKLQDPVDVSQTNSQILNLQSQSMRLESQLFICES